MFSMRPIRLREIRFFAAIFRYESFQISISIQIGIFFRSARLSLRSRAASITASKRLDDSNFKFSVVPTIFEKPKELFHFTFLYVMQLYYNFSASVAKERVCIVQILG